MYARQPFGLGDELSFVPITSKFFILNCDPYSTYLSSL